MDSTDKNLPEIVIGSDHAAFDLKEFLKPLLATMGYGVQDVGTFTRESCDYPDFAEKVALAVKNGGGRLRGILSCGTGIGAAIAANKVPGIRAALVTSVETALVSRKHNDANVLVLGGRPFDPGEVERMVKTWLSTDFEGGRHERRIEKIQEMEKKYMRGER
jgi:ribose 5-phosphate isomerase B